MDMVIGDSSKHEGASDAYFWAGILDEDDEGLVVVKAREPGWESEETSPEEGWGEEEDGDDQAVKGGPGSGYFAPHAGRPGQRGGSAPRGMIDELTADDGDLEAKSALDAVLHWVPDGRIANRDALERYPLDSEDYETYAQALMLNDPNVQGVMAELGMSKEDVYKMIADARMKIISTSSTKRLHAPGGLYTPEREALHDQIVAEFLKNAPPPARGKPTLLMTGGIPGAGKSSILKTEHYADRVKAYVHLDSDEVKARLAAADGIDNVTWEAGKYHAESVDVLDRLMYEAVSTRRNVLYDATMKSSSKFFGLIDAARVAGYRTEIAFADLPLDKAIGRAITRFIRGGRFVDPAYVASHDHRNRENFQDLDDLVDEAKRWDTDVPYGQPAILVK